jgi:two-component system response regulator NreC
MAGHLQLAPEPDPRSRAGATHRPIRVVLADDHVALRRSLRLLLDREPDVDVVAEAADLATVLRHVHRHSPHVLVLDVPLHGGSSLETISQLRNSAPDIEIVVLSMEMSWAFAEQALEAGAAGFVLKDRSDSDLPAAIRAAARGDEFVSPPVAVRLDALSQAVGDDGLTRREHEIVRLIALGHTSAEVAGKLHLSRRTVEAHRARIHRKLAVKTCADLISHALGRRLLDA